MSDSVSTFVKPKMIRYEIKNIPNTHGGDVVTYLSEHGLSPNPQVRIKEAVEAFYLSLSVSPSHPHFRSIVLESLTLLEARINLIQELTGIKLPSRVDRGYPLMAHPNQDLVPKMGNSVITDPPQVEGNQVATLAVKPQLDPFQELAFILNKYSQELVDGADPLKISQALNQLQPDDEEAWTQEMWDMYDVLVEQASAANYQVTFNSETN